MRWGGRERKRYTVAFSRVSALKTWLHASIMRQEIIIQIKPSKAPGSMSGLLQRSRQPASNSDIKPTPVTIKYYPEYKDSSYAERGIYKSASDNFSTSSRYGRHPAIVPPDRTAQLTYRAPEHPNFTRCMCNKTATMHKAAKTRPTDQDSVTSAEEKTNLTSQWGTGSAVRFMGEHQLLGVREGMTSHSL